MNEFQRPASCLAHSEQAAIQIKRILHKERTPFVWLVEGSDGICYRTRFLTTSESRKLLINQWIESYFLQQLAVSTTAVQILQVSPAIAKNDPDLYCLLSSQNDKEQPLVCLGSRYPVHVEQGTCFGLLPKPLWGKIVNPGDFATAFVLDQALGIKRYRHILYTRDRPSHPPLFKAYFVTNGDILGGSDWTIENQLDFDSYCLPHAYPIVTPAQWLQALELVGSYRLLDCQAALAGFPESWLEAGERGKIERLLGRLQHRQQTLSEWIQIPSRCLHFPTREVLQSALKPTASAALSPALSPA